MTGTWKIAPAAALLAGAVLAPAGAAAATQMLALVGGGAPTTLSCENDICAADLSAFCLQPGRPSPEQGARYRFAAEAPVRLVGVRPDGSEVALVAARELTVRALRTHVAVRLSLPADALTARGLARVRIEVGERVSLLPERRADDPTPLSESEVAVTTGPLRAVGERLVDRDPVRMQAARVTAGLINALPRSGRETPERRADLWRSSGVPDAPAGPGKELARDAYDRCVRNTTVGTSDSLRRCLESEHDIFVGELNTRYWDALKTGS